jgi:hypothetical protein
MTDTLLSPSDEVICCRCSNPWKKVELIESGESSRVGHREGFGIVGKNSWLACAQCGSTDFDTIPLMLKKLVKLGLLEERIDPKRGGCVYRLSRRGQEYVEGMHKEKVL